jgi:hypothetical protein
MTARGDGSNDGCPARGVTDADDGSNVGLGSLNMFLLFFERRIPS